VRSSGRKARGHPTRWPQPAPAGCRPRRARRHGRGRRRCAGRWARRSVSAPSAASELTLCCYGSTDAFAPIPDLPLVRPGSLVIEANPLKYSVMAARSLALGLLLLLCVTPVGWAAEPAGATVVLQLPASMSPDQVKGLIADLAAKGAEPVATSVIQHGVCDCRRQFDSAVTCGLRCG
jgi:hypothetical protein